MDFSKVEFCSSLQTRRRSFCPEMAMERKRLPTLTIQVEATKNWGLSHQNQQETAKNNTQKWRGYKNNTPMWVFPKIRVPQNGWFIVENRIKIHDLGVPLFFGNTHVAKSRRFAHLKIMRCNRRNWCLFAFENKLIITHDWSTNPPLT